MYFSRYCESPYVNTFTAHNNMYVNSLHYIVALLDFTINKHIFSVRSPFQGWVSVNVRSVYLLGTLIRYRNVFRYWREFGFSQRGLSVMQPSIMVLPIIVLKGVAFTYFGKDRRPQNTQSTL